MAAHKVVKKKKNNEEKAMFRSNSDFRKYHHAIIFGAREAKVILSQEHHGTVGEFVQAYKKEAVKKKSAGLLMDERDSDPITFIFFQKICEWALASNNIFLWVFGLLQWNCMARSVSIDPLGFHNFKIGTDSLKCTYDNSKSDQSGEKVSPKNIYANPLKPVLCVFTALGIL
jgi:hypothetical protein